MSGTLIAIIILTAIFGGYVIDYQKNKLKWQSKNAESSKDFDELKVEMDRMRKRIEHLEAIVTDEPAPYHDDFSIDLNADISDQSKTEQGRKTSIKTKKGD